MVRYDNLRKDIVLICSSFSIRVEVFVLTLKDGAPGDTFRIQAVGDSDLKQRLMTMGLLPGTKVAVLRSAPFGDPMAIRVRSYNLALRREDAAKIEVQKIS